MAAPTDNDPVQQKPLGGVLEMVVVIVHDGQDCDCLAFEGIGENTADRFARRIDKSKPGAKDFRSPHELQSQMELKSAKAKCKYRGISINLVGNHEAAIIKKYAEQRAFSPQGQKGYYCEFTFKDDAGKVWDTRTDKNPTHYTFFKCEAFTTKRIKVVKVVPI